MRPEKPLMQVQILLCHLIGIFKRFAPKLLNWRKNDFHKNTKQNNTKQYFLSIVNMLNRYSSVPKNTLILPYIILSLKSVLCGKFST